MTPQPTAEMPARLVGLLRRGTPAILATVGEDEWPNVVMTWADED